MKIAGNSNIHTAIFCENCGNKLNLKQSNDIGKELKDRIEEMKSFEKQLRNFIYEITDSLISKDDDKSPKKVNGSKESFSFNRLKMWFNRQGKEEKIFMGIVVFFIIVISLVPVIGMLTPELTKLTMGEYNPQIGNNTTYTLKGIAEANAIVIIGLKDLQLNETKVNVDSSGRFEYTVNVPIGVMEAVVQVKATSPSKKENFQQIIIERPSPVVTTPAPAPSVDNSADKNLENNVKNGVENFFKDFNAMYNEDGANNGYLIKTITIDKVNKISNTEVDVTVSLNRIASNGDEFDSKWGGSFYLKKGIWVDDGNFAQTYSYNKNTGEKVPLLSN